MSETVEGQVPVESVKVLNACEVATEEANGCEAANGNAENLRLNLLTSILLLKVLNFIIVY